MCGRRAKTTACTKNKPKPKPAPRPPARSHARCRPMARCFMVPARAVSSGASDSDDAPASPARMPSPLNGNISPVNNRPLSPSPPPAAPRLHPPSPANGAPVVSAPGAPFDPFSTPGILKTEPSVRLMFNAPYDRMQFVRMKLTNPSDKRCAFKVEVSNPERLHVATNRTGIIRQGQSLDITVCCKVLDVNPDQNDSDLVKVTSRNVPEEQAEFDEISFEGGGAFWKVIVPTGYSA